jgi:hypothetical protein
MGEITDSGKIRELRNKITDEICYALGLGRSGWRRFILRPLVWLPADRFSRFVARFDARVPLEGLPGGARQLMSDLGVKVQARGLEQVPREGPLLVVSNHPGAYDSIAIASLLPRKDLKIVVSDIPFLRAVPETCQRFIFVPPAGSGRMAVLREAIQHLQSGGAVMIFAHGDVEPDPGFMQGARETIGEWSASVEVMLRKAPQAWLQVVIASDVLVEKFVRSPIARLRRTPTRQQKLAEFLQVIQQLVFPGSVRAEVHLSFARPVPASELGPDRLMPGVIALARALLGDHLAAFKENSI